VSEEGRIASLTGKQASSAFQIKSILKPTIPLTPPKAIPTFDESRKRSAEKSSKKSPKKNGGEELLIDFSTPAPSHFVPTVAGAEKVQDPFSPLRKTNPPGDIAAGTRPEEEREAAELRKAQKQAIMEQRAARRKSMANRRVSFAKEATLHTWNVVELVEDSTTSSASNSTRRQSSMTATQTPNKTQQSIAPASEQVEPPSTPPEQVEEPLVKASPAHQRDLHQQRRRRSSAGSNLTSNAVERTESSPASTYSGSSAVGDSSPVHVEDSIHSSSDEDGDTAMSMDDATGQTIRSELSSSSTASSLDDRLRRAAAEAGTRGIEYDENGDDLSMELAEGTITNAFQPWVNNRPVAAPAQDLSAMQDQENINPFSPAFKAKVVEDNVRSRAADDEQTQSMTMDMTVARGDILSKKPSPNKGRRKSVAPSRRRSSVGRRRSSGDGSAVDDETMEFTVMEGGIVQPTAYATADDEDDPGSDEEMTMEMTNVVGGMLENTRRESAEGISMDETMDMTAAIGSILPPIEERTEPQSEMGDVQTMEMDFTRAAGIILSNAPTESKSRAKEIMEAETDVGQLSASPQSKRATSPPKQNTAVSTLATTSVASETGSPSMALKPRLSGRKIGSTRASVTPKSAVKSSTPLKGRLSSAKHATPTKQLTPQPLRAETPERTPVLPNVVYRSASPKKLFRAEMKAKAFPATSQKSASKAKSLFDRNEETGQQTPSVVLHAPKPHQHLRRRSSGIGIDQEGLGSPRVSALLDRRRSIGDDASPFVPHPGQAGRLLRFDDPKTLEDQIDAEREEEERRESGRFIMEREADQPQYPDEENTTLRDMIESLTPKKNKPSKLKGRKSLHVGAARGILGKRPAELDLEDEEEDAESTPNRLKAMEREASPVKKVHLPKPPSKDETTGRVTRAKRRSLEETAGNAQITPTLSKSPGKPSAANTPQPRGRFRDTSTDPGTPLPTSFEDKLDNVIEAVDLSVLRDGQDQEAEKISLQDFLNMTNIHFIELSTTKRRHTLAPAAPSQNSKDSQLSSNQACFAAAATTLPLLELYQHATRELKSYISTGRKIIRSIEQETLEEQPALFREYVDARPDVKAVMDNQFRNGKANARLQSKEGWYAWRRQLAEGLRGGLEGIKADMEHDAQNLSQQEEILENTVPGMVKHFAELEQEAQLLQQRAEEFESVDYEALNSARAQLGAVDEEVANKAALLIQLQQEMTDKAEALSAAEELKTEFESQIAEAERVQNECRGWKAGDVHALKERVQTVETRTGWTLVTAEHEAEEGDVDFGPALTLRYRNALRLFFYPAAFQADPSNNAGRRKSRRSKSDSGPSAPISLTFAPGDDSATTTLTTHQRFFLQLLQGHLHALAVLPKGSVSAKSLLRLVSEGWDLSSKVSEEIRFLEMAGITNVSIQGDEKLRVQCMLILPGKSRVDVQFTLTVNAANDGSISTSIAVNAVPKYGSVTALLTGAKASKVHDALNKHAASKAVGEGACFGAIRGLEDWISLQTKTTANNQEQQQPKKAPPKPAAAPTPLAAPKPAETPTPAPALPKKELKKPVPIEEVLEEAAARQEEIRRQGEEMLMSATKTPAPPGRRPGALRRSP
jgi:kinetochore protein Spc7/SPC105